VEVLENKEEDSSILLPEECFMKPKFAKAVLRDKADDCIITAEPGTELLIDNTMLEEISVEEDNYCLILENYVLGVFG